MGLILPGCLRMPGRDKGSVPPGVATSATIEGCLAARKVSILGLFEGGCGLIRLTGPPLLLLTLLLPPMFDGAAIILHFVCNES